MISRRWWLVGWLLLVGVIATTWADEPAPAKPSVEPLYSGDVNALAFSPDGRMLASGGVERSVRLWDVVKGEEIRRCEGHNGQVKGLAFAPDGRLLASASTDLSIALWDPAAGTRLRDCRNGHADALCSLCFSADGKVVASGDYDGGVRTWDAQTGKELRRFHGHEGAISGVALSLDGSRLATAGHDSTLRIWDTSNGKQLRMLNPVNHGEILGVAYCARGRCLVAAGANGELVRMTEDRGEIQTWGRAGMSAVLTVSADGKTVAIGSSEDREGEVALYEAITWREICRFRLGTVASSVPGFSSCEIRRSCIVRSIALTPASDYLAVGGSDGHINVWHLEDLTGAKPKQALEERDREALWNDLGSTDAKLAYGAVAALASQPEMAILMLTKGLAAEPALDVARVKRLVQQLGDEDFETREMATAELKKTLPRSEEILRTAMKQEQDLEIRLRLSRVVAALEEPPVSTQRARVPRALMALEQMGTAKARGLLEKLAERQGDPLLAADAKAVLGRLERRR